MCWREFTWFKKYTNNEEGPPSTDYNLFSLLFGVDAFPLYYGLFSRKGVTSFSLALGNTPGLTNRSEWTIPIALVEGKEGDPLVQSVARLIDSHFLMQITTNGRSIVFNPCVECTVQADDAGNSFTGIQKCNFSHNSNRSGRACGLVEVCSSWLKIWSCLCPGAQR